MLFTVVDNIEDYLFTSDDHGFSPLHWACKEGHAKIVELLIQRGARINVTNRGDDTPLHLAAAHGHREIVHMVTFFYKFNVINMYIEIKSFGWTIRITDYKNLKIQYFFKFFVQTHFGQWIIPMK